MGKSKVRFGSKAERRPGAESGRWHWTSSDRSIGSTSHPKTKDRKLCLALYPVLPMATARLHLYASTLCVDRDLVSLSLQASRNRTPQMNWQRGATTVKRFEPSI